MTGTFGLFLLLEGIANCLIRFEERVPEFQWHEIFIDAVSHSWVYLRVWRFCITREPRTSLRVLANAEVDKRARECYAVLCTGQRTNEQEGA